MRAHTLEKAKSAGIYRLVLGALPYLVMAVVVGFELSPSRTTGQFLSLLSLGPALASVSRRAPSTALIGVLALAICAGISWRYGLHSQPYGSIPFITIAGVTAVGVVASAGRQRREQQLSDIKAVAEIAQAVLLRPAPSEVPGARIAVRYISATAAARIGGDLYEVIATPSRVRLIVGDVQGKGIAAVRTASLVLGAFREAAYEAGELAEIATRIEQSMRNQGAEQEFVTAVLAQITPGSGVIEVLSCGHPPPLLAHRGDVGFADPPSPGLPLGLGDLSEDPRAAHSWPFSPGDQVLFYTDGISEARDKAGAFYPLAQQCGQFLAAEDPEAALDLLADQVARHVGHKLTDDAAMLLVRATAASQDPAAPELAAPKLETTAQDAAALDPPGRLDAQASGMPA